MSAGKDRGFEAGVQRDVASIAAHELHHDVQVARLLVDQLQRLPSSDDGEAVAIHNRLAQALALLERNVDRLLLDGGADLDQLRPSPTNLGDLVQRVVATHANSPHPIEVKAASLTANVDGVKIERLLDNLLVNALQHTPPDCPVTVTLNATVERGRLGIMLTVEDEGPGLPDDVRTALLSQENWSPDAAGMGLWIVVRFARLHRGDVAIQAGPEGRGARITVRLPT